MAARLDIDYDVPMSQESAFKAVRGVAIASAMLVVLLTGCLGYADRGGRGIVRVSQSARYEPPMAEDYVYYPGYQMYYGSRTHQYYYVEGSSWVARPEPQGISPHRLLSAPSVKMDFHDSPAAHHQQVIRSYPKTWNRSGGEHGRKADPKENSRNGRNDDDDKR